MELPLLLAGPIVRRVDPGLFAVWTAFSRPAEVTVNVWEGRVAWDTTNAVFASSDDPPDPNAPPPLPGADALRIGEQLYLSLVSVRLPPASGKVFESDRIYSYNLLVTAEGTVSDLETFGLLTEHQVSGVTAGPLGYADRMLPSFVLPPSTLDDLQIGYGSCRRPGYDDGDALAWMDDHLNDRITDPRARLHQLFLGGDQIYADDVDSVMMLRLAELGVELIGRTDGTPVERIAVETIRKRNPAVPTPDPKDPDAAYVDEPAAETTTVGGLPAGPPSFPVGHRLHLTQVSGQLTSIDGSNHLISFGEFAAAYLLCWAPHCWGVEIPGAQLIASPGGTPSGPVRWLDELTEQQTVAFPRLGVPDPVHDLPDPALGFPDRVPRHLFEDAATLAAKAEEAAEKDPAAERRKQAAGRRRSHRVHREFLLGLAKVQRLLANVPTYMILDDHDLTDDFFLNPMWRHRVLGSPLGQSILINGMAAYALFQDWGNDPRRYDDVTTPQHPELGGMLPGDLLQRCVELFPAGQPRGPQAAAFTTLGRMFGHHLENPTLPNGRFGSITPPILWHFTVDGPKHRVVALDNRTRRSFVAEIGPPGNVSADALVDQLPPAPLPAGREVLVVIAPLQVIGPPVIDEVVGRAIYRIFDAVTADDLATDQTSGSRQMPGTNPDALETWALDEGSFEHLLARLAEYPRVVVLSGDVHNAASNVMSYWRGNASVPSRIAQFTSSGFKNVMPVYLRSLDASAMLLQELLRAKLGVERFGWTRPEADLVLLPTGRTEDDLVAVTRAKLLRSPVLLPAHGWPDDNLPGESRVELSSRLNPARPPEWRWRVTPLLDERLEVDRPSPIRVEPVDDDAVEDQAADPATIFAALQTVAVRHQNALRRMRNTRQMMFRSNFGLCRFETDGDRVTAIGEVHTQAVDPDTQLRVLGPYLVHRADLGPDPEEPPERLRRVVVERVPIPEEPP